MPPFGDDDIQALDDVQRRAVSAFEEGWAEEWSSIENRRKALRRWVQVGPLYLQSWANAIQGSAKCERWSEVRGLMKRLASNKSGFGIEEQLNFAWIALRGGLPETSPWLEVARGPSFNSPNGLTLLTATKIARIVGYRDLLREPAQVSEDFARLLDRRHYRPQYQASSRLILRGATVLGRLWRYVDRNDPEVATTVPIRDIQPLLNTLWLERPDWRTVEHEDINLGPQIGAELASAMWRSRAYDKAHQIAMARSVFSRFWGMAPGLQAFNMLLEAEDSDWLEVCIEKLVEETISNLHEQSYNDRVETTATLIGFAERLGDTVSVSKLESCSKRTRIGYSGHKEWVFRPLSSWLEFLVERSPDEWKKSGLRMLRLDRLCNAQHGESGFSDELITILGAGAIMAGPQHLAYLWERLESHNKRWGNLWVLTKAVRDGFVHVLKSKHPLSNEVVQSLTALCAGLGRWPKESAVAVIDSLECELPPEHPYQETLSQIRVIAANFYPHNIVKEPSDDEPHDLPRIDSGKPPLTSDEILRQSDGDSFYDGFRLATIAKLGQALSDEKRADRAVIMNDALERFSRCDALNRCLDPHEERLMTSICHHLTNDEQWKLLEAITAVTGPLRSQLNDEPWGHMVAFNAVDLLCQARAKNGSADLGRQAAEHLLQTHEAWAAHPSFKETLDPVISHPLIQWRDTVRELLLRLLESDACETVYSAMSGLRLLAEMYPQQIPAIVRHGMKSHFKQEVVLLLGEIWACRFPDQMKGVQNDLKTASEEMRLDQ
ncbi:MAG: hypothetical protein OJI67_24495, partial [Prosthecobacter sp.]|nr:hypothetical protein [Prosthecobacter sp.]